MTVAHLGPIHATPDTSTSWVHDLPIVHNVLSRLDKSQRSAFLRAYAARYRQAPHKPADVSGYRWAVDTAGRHQGRPDVDWMGHYAPPVRHRAPSLCELDAVAEVADFSCAFFGA